MTCSCIKGEWIFNVNILDTKNLEFVSRSAWNEEGPYIIPDKHEIAITTPEGKEIKIKVNPTGSTIIKNTDLGLSESDCIEDGIYCFSAYACVSCESGAGDRKFTKQELIAPQLDCSIRQLVAKGKTEFYGRLKEIEASAKLGLSERVNELYMSLEDDVSMESCDKCC